MNQLWNALNKAKELKWIEVLKNLDKLPPVGAVLFASWPNFKGANGLPCRVFALTE